MSFMWLPNLYFCFVSLWEYFLLYVFLYRFYHFNIILIVDSYLCWLKWIIKRFCYEKIFSDRSSLYERIKTRRFVWVKSIFTISIAEIFGIIRYLRTRNRSIRSSLRRHKFCFATQQHYSRRFIFKGWKPIIFRVKTALELYKPPYRRASVIYIIWTREYIRTDISIYLMS